ncbi:Uncharacterised protein [Salmonella enterica subsp. enterica serovar Typhimurium str. DT104]|nr:Uncharacterised protein [Salmonella enterica subsp. enterica serovar Typhimurium str. DT104]
MEAQPLKQRIDGTTAQQRRHPVTLSQRTNERHMDGKIKTGREPFGFRHQLTTERQGLFPFSRREFRIRIFDLSVMSEQCSGVSHFCLHLQCTEGVNATETSIEIF